jgi:Endoribonuclease XendoU
MEFLVVQGSISPDYQDHYDMIKTLWFDFYPRNKNTTSTSSGFEHIFLSEVKKGKVIGLEMIICFITSDYLPSRSDIQQMS